MYGKRRNAPVTDFLILVNILVFLYVALRGGMRDDEVLLRCGASYTPYVLERQGITSTGDCSRQLFCTSAYGISGTICLFSL